VALRAAAISKMSLETLQGREGGVNVGGQGRKEAKGFDKGADIKREAPTREEKTEKKRKRKRK